MKKYRLFLVAIALFVSSYAADAQRFTVSTNVLDYACLGTMNVEGSYALCRLHRVGGSPERPGIRNIITAASLPELRGRATASERDYMRDIPICSALISTSNSALAPGPVWTGMIYIPVRSAGLRWIRETGCLYFRMI